MTTIAPEKADTTGALRAPAAPRRAAVPDAVRTRRLDRLVLFVIAALGATRLTFPLTGDQAYFMIGARAMSRGAVFYRDFLDVKQPGIYLFYLAAGTLGGFNEVAVHLLELATLLAFSWVLQRAGRRLFGAGWAASLLPLFAVGLYYATARPWELTQLEALIGIPLFGSVWWALRAVDAKGRRQRVLLVGAGAAAGVAGILKLVCMPLALPAWIVAVVLIARRRAGTDLPARLRSATATLAWIGLGVVASLGIVATYFTIHGLWHEVMWVYFTYTPKTTAIAGRPISRLVGAVARYGALWAPMLLLTIAGLVTSVRRGWDRWSLAFAGWIAAGVPVWVVQHWWPYQLQMFLVPFGFFAVRGAQAFVASWRDRSRRQNRGIVAVLLLSALPLTVSFGHQTLIAASDMFGIAPSARAAVHEDFEPQYRIATQLAQFIAKNDPGHGAAYVLGNPIDLYVSGRPQAISTGGWAAEQYDATMWHRISSGLEKATPAVLVVDDVSAQKMREHSPEARAVITSLYCPAQRVGSETWYLLRSHAVCPPNIRPNI
ncbi:MAG: hypothetical protein JOZ99_15210 [Actinobacteria bacterium]|nr:hypothetical protein [Actinomycetota bacterium]